MASSTLSLDSLSSPSPSPSPPPTNSGSKSKQTNSNSTATAAKAATAALDSDSELSELTEDDQEGAVSGDKRDRGASNATASSSKTPSRAVPLPQGVARAVPSTAESSVDDDDDENDNNTGSSANHLSKNTTAKRGSHQRTLSTTSRRGGAVGRKKRSSIVPAPMWGWAEAKASANSSAPVEEEEEEITGPPRAMEEEEEEPPEEEEEEGGGDGDYNTPYSQRRDDSVDIDEDDDEEDAFVKQRRLGPYVTQRLPGIRSFYRKGRGGGRGGRKQNPASSPRKHVKDEDDDDEPVVNGDEVDDGSASGSEYNNSSTRKKKPLSTTKARGGAAFATRKRKDPGGHESSASEAPANSAAKRKPKKSSRGRIAALHEGDDTRGDEVTSEAPNVAVDAGTGDDNTEDEEDTTPKKPPPAQTISISSMSPPKATLPGLKPLSAIGHVSISNPGATNLTVLAVLADLEKATVSEPPGDATKSSSASSTSGVAAVEAEGVTSTTAANDPSAATSVDPTPAASTVNSDTEAEPKKRKTKTRRGVRPVKSGRKGLKISASNPAEDDHTEYGDEQDDGMDVDPVAKEGDKDVDMEGDERAEGEDDEGEEEIEDDDLAPADKEVAEADVEGEVENEGEEEVGEDEGDEETGEPEPENEDAQEKENEVEEAENEEVPSPDGELEDQEIELQPAHRAEALDVLASIELKFALLRERVYVEKMENLAWEETMIQASVHPEMQYLQKEMTKRRDKRLELASRKRAYEVANASKRRRADEDSVWGWWQLSVDELQTDMIAETNRKRRRLERDRRAVERPQPIRRIPLPPPIETVPPHHPPSIRKIIKSYPLDSIRKQSSRSHSRRYPPSSHFTSGQQPSKNLIYPEISTLSAGDIASDLEYLFQNRRIPSSGFDGVQFGAGPPPPPLWGQPPVGQRNGLGLGRTMSMGLSMGISNGGLPPPGLQPSVMGPPPPPSSHGLSYDQYSESPMYAPPPGPSGQPPRVEQASGLYSGSSGRGRPPYPMEHEISTIGPAPGAGHQLLPNHPYFGNAGPGPSVMKNGRRSTSPSSSQIPNGAGPSGLKMNGGWMGLPVKGGDRDVRMGNEEDDRIMREREPRDRKRDKDVERREQWEEIERERMRDRERDSHRSGTPAQVPGMEAHHHPNRTHHHHILHRHGPPHASSSLPSPGASGPGGALPIVHSPRSGREYEGPRPPLPGHPTTEVIMLSSSKPGQHLPPREREILPGPHHPPHPDYRDRERDRERDIRKSFAQRPPSRPLIDGIDDRQERPLATPFVMASTHAMQQSSGRPPPPSHMNGSASSSSSPKGQPLWNTPTGDDPSFRNPTSYSHAEPHRSPVQTQRFTPGGIPPPPLGRGIPSSASSTSLHRMGSPPPPSSRARPPPSPSYPGPPNAHRSPMTSPKMRPPSPISSKLLGPGRTVTPTGHHPPSTSHTASGAPPPSALDPIIKNGSVTPNYPLSSRTASPLMSSLHPPPSSGVGSRPAVNGNGSATLSSIGGSALDQRLVSSVVSPRLGPSLSSLPPPPPKMSTAPVADGR